MATNERLRIALQNAGLQPEDLADELEVDIRTVRRWLGGTEPYPRYRVQTLAILNRTLDLTERDLWPGTTAPPAGDDSRDLVAIYNRGDDIRVPDWRGLLRQATTHIDLLDTTLIQLFATAGIAELQRERARAGAEIRILTAHPQSIWITSLAEQLRDADRDDAGRTQLDRDLQLAHRSQEPLIDEANIQTRTHWTERASSILRFDDEMLVTLHLWATIGAEAPVMHLRRRGDGGLFDRFAGHFEAIWSDASEPLEAGLHGTP